MKSPNSAAVLGALVADSAALGLHWLYDPQRIAIIEASKGLAFLQPDPAHYEGARAILHMAERWLANPPATAKPAC